MEADGDDSPSPSIPSACRSSVSSISHAASIASVVASPSGATVASAAPDPVVAKDADAAAAATASASIARHALIVHAYGPMPDARTTARSSWSCSGCTARQACSGASHRRRCVASAARAADGAIEAPGAQSQNVDVSMSMWLGGAPRQWAKVAALNAVNAGARSAPAARRARRRAVLRWR